LETNNFTIKLGPFSRPCGSFISKGDECAESEKDETTQIFIEDEAGIETREVNPSILKGFIGAYVPSFDT